MGRTVVLVACVGQKRDVPSPARDLYVSQWFRKARAYAERVGDAWYILSAEHGLLDPAQVTAPYERTLNTMAAEDRRAWAYRVLTQASGVLRRSDDVVVLAGWRYRVGIVGGLLQRVESVACPLSGLGIGQQLAWFNRNMVEVA